MADQRVHWNGVYSENRAFFGTDCSEFFKICSSFLKGKGCKDILELGPGQGRDSLGFVIDGYNLTGFECSDVACGILKERIPGMKVRLGDIRDGIDLPKESFDACYAHMVLIMDMTPGDVRRVMKNICNLLRPGGYFMFSVRNTSDPGFGKGNNTHDNVWVNDKGFAVNFFTEDEVREFSAGYEMVELKEFQEDTKRLFSVILRKN